MSCDLLKVRFELDLKTGGGTFLTAEQAAQGHVESLEEQRLFENCC